jgi:poly-gamma-glutamate capsule biosynthesis protein CapA/YwtB (metallophosphatase superfamily)
MSRQSVSRFIAILLGAVIASEASAQVPISGDPGIKLGAGFDPHRPLSQELSTSAGAALRVVAVGSLALSVSGNALRPFDPELVALLGGGVDERVADTVTVGDLETSIIDATTFEGYPYPWGAAATPMAGPSVASSLKRSGFSMFSRANDHALDWGVEGMRSTGQYLDQAGLAHAGTGLNEGLARSPGYYDSKAGLGRIALVSAATTFRPNSQALNAGSAPARAGVSAIETNPVRVVSPGQLRQLQEIACRYKHFQQSWDCTPTLTPVSVTTLGSTFEADAHVDAQYKTIFRLNNGEAQRVLRYVRQGRQSADYLIVAFHSGQVTDARSSLAEAPDFLQALARASVDSGADLVMNTGGPLLGPIEIYRSPGHPPRPIFYGLGNFCWSEGLASSTPSEQARWSILARTSAVDSTLTVELYPLDLSRDRNHPDGWPHLADKALSPRILRRLALLSEPYGTHIEIEPYGSSYRGVITARSAGEDPAK